MTRIAWKLYFWLLMTAVTFILASDIYLAFYGTYPETSDIIVNLSFTVGALGVFGYVYKKRILSANVWKLVFYIELITFILTTYLFGISYEPGLISSVGEMFMALILILFSLPEVCALFLYSYKSENIWS